MFAGILGFGLVTGRPLLEALLGSAYPGLNALGWRKLTRNWAVFFVAMALLNEIVWRSTNWDFWVGFKLWGALPLTFLFALANVPMRSEEHTSELQSLMRISYAVFCLKNKKYRTTIKKIHYLHIIQ